MVRVMKILNTSSNVIEGIKEANEANEEIKNDEILHDIPPKSVLGINLKELKEFRELRVNMKKDNMDLTFKSEVNKVLALFNVDDYKYNDKILLFVMNLCENYFIYDKKSGEKKQNMTIELMKPFYDNNEELIKKQIQLLFPNVVQTTTIKRLSKKIIRFFLQIVGL